MSREVLLSLGEANVRAKCLQEDVSVSVIERLRDGGVRLVCMSSHGAAVIRRKLKENLIEGNVVRVRHRPKTPMW